MAGGARRRAVERTGLLRSLRPSRAGAWILGLGLAVVLVVVLVVAAVVAVRTGGPDATTADHDGPPSTAGDTGGTADGGDAAGGPWDPYATTRSGGRAATAAEQSEWEPIVERFTTSLLTPAPTAQWRSSLEPLVTEQLADRLRLVDPANLPGGSFVSAEVATSGDTAADVTVTVRSGRGDWDLGVRIVDLPDDGVGWRVYAYANRTAGEDA